MSYASNVIVNFGSNASQLFKGMQKVKAEIKGVQAQAAAATKASSAVAMAGRGPGMFKQGLGALRFGAGIITGFLGVNVLRELFDPIKEGFNEVVKKSDGFNLAIDVATKGLTMFGEKLGQAATSSFSRDLLEGITRALFPVLGVNLPSFEMLSKTYAAVKENNFGLFGSEYTTPVSEHEKWQREQNELAKKQAAYLRDTRDTLRRMENDLERMNTLDHW